MLPLSLARERGQRGVGISVKGGQYKGVPMVQEANAVEMRATYSRLIATRVTIIVASTVILVAVILVATSLGAAGLSLKSVFNAILAKFLPVIESDSLDQTVIWHLRLPRVIMGVIAGAGLAVAGTVMQGVLRNPLVSPFTIGVSSAAAFGASIAIMFGVGIVGSGTYLIIANAFIFAVACALLVYGISWLRGVTPETMILAGIALMYLFSALTATLQFFASELQLQSVVHWTFGSLTRANWESILITFTILAVSFPFLMRYAWAMNAIASGGDDVAKSLGINTSLVRIVSSLLAVLITAAIISFTGVIGFVCLVGPHIARMIIGADHRFLIVYSGIVGAILLVTADTIGKTAFSPVIIPVGIVISYLGVPLFINLILTRRKEYFQ